MLETVKHCCPSSAVAADAPKNTARVNADATSQIFLLSIVLISLGGIPILAPWSLRQHIQSPEFLKGWFSCRGDGFPCRECLIENLHVDFKNTGILTSVSQFILRVNSGLTRNPMKWT